MKRRDHSQINSIRLLSSWYQNQEKYHKKSKDSRLNIVAKVFKNSSKLYENSWRDQACLEWICIIGCHTLYFILLTVFSQSCFLTYPHLTGPKHWCDTRLGLDLFFALLTLTFLMAFSSIMALKCHLYNDDLQVCIFSLHFFAGLYAAISKYLLNISIGKSHKS